MGWIDAQHRIALVENAYSLRDFPDVRFIRGPVSKSHSAAVPDTSIPTALLSAGPNPTAGFRHDLVFTFQLFGQINIEWGAHDYCAP